MKRTRSSLLRSTATMQSQGSRRLIPSLASEVKWWLPELTASCISLSCLIALIIVLAQYNGQAVAGLTMPAGLTLNGIVAALSTLNRASLMVPVGACLSQEAWLWFSPEHDKKSQRLRDLNISDAASRGSWGSIVLLCKSGRHW
jgi:hypothetical protein